MGIGVSFCGHDGQTRKFNLTSVPKIGEEAAQVLGAQQNAVRDALSRKLLPNITNIGGNTYNSNGKVCLDSDDNDPGYLSEKMAPTGSVTVSKDGVCLKGDESATFGELAVYGKVKGEPGFRALADYDSGTSDSKRLGIVGVGGKDAEVNDATGAYDAIWQTISRLRIETDDLGRKILCQYERDVRKTAFGRVVSVSGERKSEIGFITEEVKPSGGNEDDPEDDPEDYPEGDGCVTSLNSAKGIVSIVGGKGVRVSTEGKTIKITVDENKEEEDVDPNKPKPDPCEHKGGGNGVSPGDNNDSGGGASAGAAGGGGVPAEGGGSQFGVNDCDK